MDTGDVVSGYGPRFFDKVEERYGREVADQVRLAAMPVDVRLTVLRSRQAAINARAGELVREAMRPEQN